MRNKNEYNSHFVNGADCVLLALVKDEPTEGLDLATERKVVARLRERLQGKTVLIVTHRPLCLELAERVVRIGRASA